MLFVNDKIVDFHQNQAMELWPGEFDLTKDVAGLGKFKLEAQWCADIRTKSNRYGWGIYIAYRNLKMISK